MTSDKPLDFARFREVNVSRCVNGFGHTLDSWSPAEWTNALCGEVGEAAEAFLKLVAAAGNAANTAKKMLRHRDNVAGNTGDDADQALLREKLRRELGDVVIYSDLTAAAIGVDLGEAVRDVFNAKSEQIGAKEKL